MLQYTFNVSSYSISDLRYNKIFVGNTILFLGFLKMYSFM
jgi:hypothetical protein